MGVNSDTTTNKLRAEKDAKQGGPMANDPKSMVTNDVGVGNLRRGSRNCRDLKWLDSYTH